MRRFDGIKEELRLMCDDMDELDAEVREAVEGVAAEREVAHKAVYEDIRSCAIWRTLLAT